MIPKKIHYCWFGGKPLPELAVKCIESWRKFCPDYEIIEWNESNYNVLSNPYTAQAYNSKKFAFVSDYARLDILYNNGGIYFDTDVEVIKSIDTLNQKGSWVGLELPGSINLGLGFACEPRNEVMKEILDSYKNDGFLHEDGSCNQKTIVTRVSDLFKRDGLVAKNEIQHINGFTVYPIDYFCPKDNKTGITTITANTCTIHHFDASWVDPWRKKVTDYQYKVIKKYGKNIFSKCLYTAYHIFMVFRSYGFIKGIRYCLGER